VSGFDGENDLLGLAAARFVVEVEASVDALVSALFFLVGTRADETERPPLELIGVTGGKALCAGQID